MSKLKIAFFGSDVFSIHSLRKIIELQARRPSLIDQVEVITRPSKRFRKQIVDVPIASAFPNLIVHRADNAREILKLMDTRSFNMAIAVSYGKLIPSKFIEHMAYGGLNVHPSSLPKYSGASPIQYSLINDERETGVSVQTLHATKFDAGEILLQENGIAIEDGDNYDTLVERLGEVGGRLVTETLERQLYVNPRPLKSGFEFSYAPRLKARDHEVQWGLYTGRQIYKRYCALGPLHTYQYCDIYSKAQKKQIQAYKRVILNDIQYHSSADREIAPGQYYVDGTNRLVVKASDDSSISCGFVHMETFKRETPSQYMNSLNKRTGSLEGKFTTMQ